MKNIKNQQIESKNSWLKNCMDLNSYKNLKINSLSLDLVMNYLILKNNLKLIQSNALKVSYQVSVNLILVVLLP